MKRSNKRKTHEEFVNEMFLLNKNILIMDTYINAHTKLKCKCLIDDNEWYADPTHLLSGRGCPCCAKRKTDASHKKKTHEEYVEKCNIINPNLEIIGIYTGALSDIECRCRICGGIFKRRASKNIEGTGCPICSGLIVVKGINDVATTHPEIVQYFFDKNDAYLYTHGSTKKIHLICPNCNTEKYMSINHLIYNGFSCNKCSDGISYPNKFSRFLLEQLPVENVCYEWTPEWAKTEKTKYRFDNYFEFNNMKYVLEMDGAFHYQKYYNSNLSLEETQLRDKEKNELSKKHDIKIIRIDCRISNKQYIIKNILDSELNEIFDLSSIDWDYCDKNSCNSIVVDVCNYYNQNNNQTVRNIAKKFRITPSTASQYLYKGSKLGICNYKPINKQSVQILYDNKIYNFDTFKKCLEEMTMYLKTGTKSGFRNALKNRDLIYDEFELKYC